MRFGYDHSIHPERTRLCVIVSLLILLFGTFYLLSSSPAPVTAYNSYIETDSSLEGSSSEVVYDASKLTLVWEMIVCGCGGFQSEIIEILQSMYESNTVGRLAVVAPHGCWCPGYDSNTIETLEYLRKQPYERWDIDVFVRHTSPQGYITEWPHAGIWSRPRLVVGRSMVEIDSVLPSWVERLAPVDAVWVPSQHSQDAFTKAGADPSKFMVLHEPLHAPAMDPARTAPLPLPGLRGFSFLSVFKWEGRKGVDLLLRAFFEEFNAEDDVSLIIFSHLFGARNAYRPRTIQAKVRLFVEQMGLDQRPNAPPVDRVVVVSERLPAVDMRRLYKTADAFVLPTHGEGWGLPVIEAMAMELPTIATDYSGVREFLTADVGFPVRTLGLEPAMGIGFRPWMRWAKVDTTHLREQMRRVFTMDLAQRREIGQRARQHVATHFSRAAVAEQAKVNLEALMHTHRLRGSAPRVCLREYKAERERARRKRLLGTHAGQGDSSALRGSGDWVAAVCSPRGQREWYARWEGLMPAQYTAWPPGEPLDADDSVTSDIFNPGTAAWSETEAAVAQREQSTAASARSVFLSSLPHADAVEQPPDSWEDRRAAEALEQEAHRRDEELQRRLARERRRMRDARARQQRDHLQQRLAERAKTLIHTAQAHQGV